MIRGRRLRVEVSQASATYALPDGEPLEIMHHGEKFSLSAGKPQVRTIKEIPPRPRPSQPPGRQPVHRRPTEEPI
jgi:alpha,alpha-trehalose phosphorylase